MFLVGCSQGQDAQAEEVWARFVCTTSLADYQTPWVDEGDVWTNRNCPAGAICWWGKAELQDSPDTKHKYFYIPEPGAVCQYQTAKGQKPNY